MIGSVLLMVVAVLAFFGVTTGYFSKLGVANWVAFLVILAFAVAAVFPPLSTASGLSISYAGFFLPLLLGVVTLFALGANSSLVRALIGSVAIAGVVIAARVALSPYVGTSRIATIIIVGIVGGIAACIICRTGLASLSAVLCGVVLGDFITAMLYRFALQTSGIFALGQNGIFDSLVAACIVSALSVELSAAVSHAVERRRGYAGVSVMNFEAGEDNDLDENSVNAREEDDLFDEYFNDDE